MESTVESIKNVMALERAFGFVRTAAQALAEAREGMRFVRHTDPALFELATKASELAGDLSNMLRMHEMRDADYLAKQIVAPEIIERAAGIVQVHNGLRRVIESDEIRSEAKDECLDTLGDSALDVLHDLVVAIDPKRAAEVHDVCVSCGEPLTSEAIDGGRCGCGAMVRHS